MAIARPAKRRKLSPTGPAKDVSSAEASTQDGHLSRIAGWDLEQQYEQRPRKQKKDAESTRLPIKTAEGRIERLDVPVAEQESEDSLLESGNESVSDINELEPADRPAVVPVRQQIIEAKEELARIGTLLSEDPEEHASGFRKLAEIANSTNPTIKKLALATQLAVYKDVIPGYRIRPHGEINKDEKVSKDVRRLRSYEQALVSGYQTYVKELARSAKASGDTTSEAAANVSTVAISCACALLLAVPHFNFRSELIKVLVDKLSSKKRDNDFTKCLETLEKLFRDDEDGNPSLDGVSQLARMMKARDYRIDESVLNTFLHLRLLSELSSRGSQNRIDKPASDSPKPKTKKEFRTKKTRKLLKERKAVEKEFSEADAIVSHEERDRLQSETLKQVFITYFRILKARIPALTGAVLEGLAKYAHLINQDFFGDLLEALKDLIATSTNTNDDDKEGEEDHVEHETPQPSSSSTSQDPLRASLLCTTTAFALLEGQDVARSAASLNLDLTFFTTHLYKSLHSYALNPDIELSAKSLRLPDPYSPMSSSSNSPAATATNNNKVNLKTPSVLLLRALGAILLPRSVPPVRVAAFVKQLYICSLQLPEKSAQAVLGLLHQVMKVHGRKVAALWNTEERKGDGVFDALRGDVEGSNPFAGTIWEGELLRYHYVPAVREGVKGVERLVREVK